MPNAVFLSLDGLDGAGKSTQCRLLAEWLRAQGHDVTQCSDPGGTDIGDILRGVLLDRGRRMTPPCEAFLFMASRAQLTAEIIRPALEAGRIVISDRFTLANIVYQGYGAGIDPEKLRAMAAVATAGLEPDLTFVLDLPPEGAAQRRRGPADRLESRDAAFHARVRAGFRAEAECRPDKIILVDAAQPIDTVQETIRLAVARRLSDSAGI